MNEYHDRPLSGTNPGNNVGTQLEPGMSQPRASYTPQTKATRAALAQASTHAINQ
ncbi:uncharacterized protein DNG_01206 [Cephalotrichum gorgonifer]|uniref:Uncharacterized protein n=1 Tax=Cephalotrichum gorgonifer TaxID=2041049 RepID=A0AAE8SRZ0_9PEZI|nr:uncharacterized protein DNG_01206 [Cephalotrichum gorgonifer]